MSVLSIYVFVFICVEYIMGLPIPDDVDNKVWTEDGYGISSTPQANTVKSWPNYREMLDDMYYLPRELKSGDTINIEGIFEGNRESFAIILGTDNENDIAFEMQAGFDTNKLDMRMVKDGEETAVTNESNRSTDDTFRESLFNLTFEAITGRDGNTQLLNFYIDSNHFVTIHLLHYHQDIHHIRIKGNVKVNSLNFSYA